MTAPYSCCPLRLSHFSSCGHLNCLFKKIIKSALTGMAQLVGHRPTKQRVTSLIPSEGTCLGCRAQSLGGAHAGGSWSMFLSLSFSLPFFSLKINFKKSFLKKVWNALRRVTIKIDIHNSYWIQIEKSGVKESEGMISFKALDLQGQPAFQEVGTRANFGSGFLLPTVKKCEG